MTTLKLTTRAAHAALSIRDFSGHRSSEPGAPGGEPCRCAPADNGNYQHAVSTSRAYEEVATGWLVLAEQMEWIDSQKAPTPQREDNKVPPDGYLGGYEMTPERDDLTVVSAFALPKSTSTSRSAGL